MTTEQYDNAASNNDPITGVIVHVVDFTTGNPVTDVEVSIKKKTGSELSKTVKRTGTDGMAAFYPLDPVEYDYEAKMDAYITSTGSYSVTSGSMTEVTVRLRKI